MKGCPTEEMLSAYVDGELEGEPAEEVRAHLKGCGLCDRCAAEFAHVTRAARETASQGPGEEEWATMWQRLRDETRPDRNVEVSAGWRVVARVALLAAAAAIMAGIILWPTIIDNGDHPRLIVSVDPQAEPNVEVVEELEVYDGSTVMCVDYPEEGICVTWLMSTDETEANGAI